MPGRNLPRIADGPVATKSATFQRKSVSAHGSSNEVEDRLYQLPAVSEAAVIGVPDDRWGETVKALVVLKTEGAATEAEPIEHRRSRLAHFKCPTSVEVRGALDRTATGKLQKYKLRQPYWEGRTRNVN